jgi:hypothetical protein
MPSGAWAKKFEEAKTTQEMMIPLRIVEKLNFIG